MRNPAGVLAQSLSKASEDMSLEANSLANEDAVEMFLLQIP